MAAVGAPCPTCGHWSEAFHSSYQRSIADLPIADRQVVVRLLVRRFRCREKTCSRRTFAEQVPLLVDRYARRTRRLRSDFEEIGLMLGGRPGSRLSSRQKKPTSRMTLLRLVRALPEPAIETPLVLGVDEFAFRRGRRYGTIVIDGSGHRVIDLLEDPSAEALVSWLTEHPGTEVIYRDALWRVGTRRSLHHPSVGFCPARRICAGSCCDAGVNWTMPNGFCLPTCAGEAVSWPQAGGWRSDSWSLFASDAAPSLNNGLRMFSAPAHQNCAVSVEISGARRSIQ